MSSLAASEVRLAELVASMSLATDLGLGQPMEHVLRSCVLGLRIAEDVGLDEEQRAVVYYVALLAWLGCHADAHEQAGWFGDDIELRADRHLVDVAGPRFVLGHIGRGEPAHRRALRLGSLLAAGGRGAVEAIERTHCLIAGQFAMRLGLGGDVRDGLQHVFERWDGKGTPAGLAGEQIALSARIAVVADIVETFRRLGGVEAAVEVARRRAGGQFDPELAGLVRDNAGALLDGLDDAIGWDAAIAAEPALTRRMSGDQLDSALAAIADFADLKSPYTTGHSRGVAERAAAAATRAGMGEAAAAQLRRAGLLHDVGRLGVSNTVWDKPGPLSESEMERVRMHPYLTQRTFSRSRLAAVADIAATHHERLDGSGYPRALAGGALSPEARILAAADAYQAMSEPRPHRPARSPEDAVRELREDVRHGRLDSDAVDAVLGAAGHRVPRRREGPAGLTQREVEVLVLLARGLSNRAIAERLVVSPKTVGHHVEHIYRKIGCSTRASASLFAMQHGLLPELPEDGPNAR